MQPIHSGTTTERIVRCAIPALLAAGFAGAFLWDGYVGYPRDNANQLARTLGVESTTIPINPGVSRNKLGRFLARALIRVPIRQWVRQLDEFLGAPGLVHGNERYYFGPTGHVRLRASAGTTPEIKWIDGVHSSTDLTVQRWMGFALLPFALGLFVHLVRIATTRTTLTDAGLRLGRKPTIPLDAVKALRVDPTSKSEVVEITYNSGDGSENVARIDAYLVKEFSAIITALSEGTGLPNPLTDAGRTEPERGPETDRENE